MLLFAVILTACPKNAPVGPILLGCALTRSVCEQRCSPVGVERYVCEDTGVGVCECKTVILTYPGDIPETLGF